MKDAYKNRPQNVAINKKASQAEKGKENKELRNTAIKEIKEQMKDNNKCCLIEKKYKRLTEYEYRLKGWAKNYQETAKERIKFYIIQLDILNEYWEKADEWGKYGACPHKEQHDGNGNYRPSQYITQILHNFNNNF